MALIGGGVAWGLTKSFPLAVAVFAGFITLAGVPLYRQYAKNNPQGYWFKRKLYGWGWVPVTWQGLLSVVVYAALIAVIFVRVDARSHSGSDTLYGIFVPFVILTAVFLWLCWKKGERPRWQWGREE